MKYKSKRAGGAEGNIKVWFADPYRGMWSADYSFYVNNPNFNGGGVLFYLNHWVLW